MAAPQFIEKRVTQTVIDQDLDTLLSAKEFRRIRKILKEETASMLKRREAGCTRG